MKTIQLNKYMITKTAFPLSARLVVGLAAASFLSGAVLNRSAKEPAAGLQPVEWKQIRAEYERHRHAAFSDPAGLQARNFKQQWLTRFDGRGFSVEPDGAAWRFGLERAGVTGAASVSSKLNRVTYRWSDALDEWFLNDTRGLEHGFTLRAPQPDLRLSVRGGLKARNRVEGIEFVDASGTARVKYTGLKAWDATGRTLKARLDVQDGGVLVLRVDDRGARYPLEIDPLVEQAALTPSNLDAGDSFGEAVAISGNTLVVGSSLENSNATGVNGNQADNSAGDSGAAYVFVRTGQTWTQEAYLKASNTEASDRFGGSVSISADTVVIGVRGEDSNSTGVNGAQNNNSASASGAAYVFSRAGSVWSQQAYLKASNTRANATFGSSVSVSGDTAVIGSPSDNGQGTGVNGSQAAGVVAPGAAYVFQRAGGVWTQRAYLKADLVATLEFGTSVAVSSGPTPVAGDTVLVGAPRSATSSVSSAAYVFVFDGSNWTSQAKLQPSIIRSGDDFGGSVALSGGTAAVGAKFDQFSEANEQRGGGAVYVFTRTGANWNQEARIKGPIQLRPTSLQVIGFVNVSFPLQARQFGRNLALEGDRLVISQQSDALPAIVCFLAGC